MGRWRCREGTGAERRCTGMGIRRRVRGSFHLSWPRLSHVAAHAEKKVPLRYYYDVYNSCACSVGFWVPGLTFFYKGSRAFRESKALGQGRS